MARYICVHSTDANPISHTLTRFLSLQEIFRREWMFKLVGDDVFDLEDDMRCLIRVNPASGMKFTYALYVDGKPFEQYCERQARALTAWEHCDSEERRYRIVLG